MKNPDSRCAGKKKEKASQPTVHEKRKVLAARSAAWGQKKKPEYSVLHFINND